MSNPLNLTGPVTLTTVNLPQSLQPALSPLNGSLDAARFYLLGDQLTGILALGSFEDADPIAFGASLLIGLESLKDSEATRLIIDVVCFSLFAWLHRIIAGPKSTTVPLPLFDTTVRNGPLAQLIVKGIVNNNTDPNNLSTLYNAQLWKNVNNTRFSSTDDWLEPPVLKVISRRQDAFSQRIGDEFIPDAFQFLPQPPDVALFDSKQVVIVSNGRCASASALFSISMQKLEGSRTVVVVVVGGSDVNQQYCGTIRGQNSDFIEGG